MKLQELNLEELKNVNGGLLGLGSGALDIPVTLGGMLGISHTNEDGQTESTILNFGGGGHFGGSYS